MAPPPDRAATPPEWTYWKFDSDDATAGKGDVMTGITDAVDPDRSRFLLERDGKLIVHHGWTDALVVPQPTVAHYRDVQQPSACRCRLRSTAKRNGRLLQLPPT